MATHRRFRDIGVIGGARASWCQMALVAHGSFASDRRMDPFVDPRRVANRRLVFEHSRDDVLRAREFLGVDGAASARDIIARVHGRMRILASAFGVGMPKTLGEIVERAGGNCVSHAVLASVALRWRGFATRLVVEDVYTGPSVLRAPAALMRVPIGPTLNGHVWVETLVDGAWTPADAELGLFGIDEWTRVRVLRGVWVEATGVRVRERWRFPLRLRRLDADGVPDENVTQSYLVDGLRSVLGGEALPEGWTDGVEHFAHRFDWEGRAGLRLLGERRRLRAMSAALAAIAARPTSDF